MNATTITNLAATTTSAVVAPPISGKRRLARRIQGIVLGLVAPTGFFTWLFGIDSIKNRINSRVWCSDADTTVFQVDLKRSGSATRVTDALLCRKDGAVVREIGNLQMMSTNLGVAFTLSLCLLGVLVVVLVTYAKLRRR